MWAGYGHDMATGKRDVKEMMERFKRNQDLKGYKGLKCEKFE